MNLKSAPRMIINAVAPIRICDNGGWTDTWFAQHGKVFNMAVSPYVEVQIRVFANQPPSDRTIVIDAENFGERYQYRPGTGWQHHPLLEAAIESMHLPGGLFYEITIFSAAPSGASTGTSAAVTVALIGALDLLTPGRMSPHQVALAAQRVETEMLGQQCGIQDQLCSAYGGINFIEIDKYPQARVLPVEISETLWWELDRRLALIYLGKAHHSSQVHEMVIRGLQDAGPDCQPLQDLRQAAEQARQALQAADFGALGQAMIANTQAQERLHPALIGLEVRRVIEIAHAHGAAGWKVNGAGGEGGSITLLGNANAQARRAMLREIEAENPQFKNIPITLSRSGLRVWTQQLPS